MCCCPSVSVLVVDAPSPTKVQTGVESLDAGDLVLNIPCHAAQIGPQLSNFLARTLHLPRVRMAALHNQ